MLICILTVFHQLNTEINRDPIKITAIFVLAYIIFKFLVFSHKLKNATPAVILIECLHFHGVCCSWLISDLG